MSIELTEFIQKNILKQRFNSNASNYKFWDLRNSSSLFEELQTYSNGKNNSIQQLVYNYFNHSNLKNVCSVCNEETKFKNYQFGYATECSLSCLQKSKKVREKCKNTMLEKYGKESNLSGDKTHYMQNKYGVDNPQQLLEVRNKSKNSKLERHGSENFNNPEKAKASRKENGTEFHIISKRTSEEYKRKNEVDIMNIARKTFKIKYKVNNPSEVKSIQDKKNANSIKRYGVPFQSKHLSKQSVILIDKKEYLESKSVREIIEETGYSQSTISKYMIKHGVTDPFRSSAEKGLHNFIRTFYDGEILINKRNIIKNREIDIFLPEFNFGIEFNGNYWHSSNFYQSHKEKFHLCLEKDIYLLQIFEYQWNNPTQREIFKSKIKLKMGFHDLKIFARNCEVKKVSPKETREFLNENHIEGSTNSSIKLGLYFNEKIVSLMTFGKSRFKKGDYELLRFVNAKGVIVVGGASKLFAYFKKMGISEHIISFSDNLYSDGNLYKQLGFKFLYETQGFFYVEPKTQKKINRLFFQKHKLKNIFDNFDESMTGKENVLNNGYFLIYDACQRKWEY